MRVIYVKYRRKPDITSPENELVNKNNKYDTLGRRRRKEKGHNEMEMAIREK